MPPKKAVVIGGGPAGAAAAIAMSEHGLQVELFEAYPHPKDIAKNCSKAYAIALGARGQEGLTVATGINPLTDIPDSIVSTELARHPVSKTMDHRDRPSLIVPRQVLTAFLLDRAQQAGVTIHYQHRLVDLNLEERVAYLECTTTSGETTSRRLSVKYDLLLGADGSDSNVRSILQASLEGFTVRLEKDSMEYQVVVLPESPFPDLPPKAVHAWNNKEYNALCLGFPLADKTKGNMLLAIVFPEGKLDSFRTNNGYTKPLKALLPDLSEQVLSQVEVQLRTGQIANGGLCVWVSSLGSPKHGVVLLGNSGHGMWPSLGQGANCALESAGVFRQCLDQVSVETETWPEDLAQAFQSSRHTDALAAVDLTYGGIGARTSRGRPNAPLSYKLQIAGMMLLHKCSAGLIPKPALLRLMGREKPLLSYSKAHKYNFYYERMICCGALATAMVIPALFWSRRGKK